MMLVDEEGLLKSSEANILGSWLYETDKHGYPIVGNVLFVGTEYKNMGIDICGVPEDVAESLKEEFEERIAKGERTLHLYFRGERGENQDGKSNN